MSDARSPALGFAWLVLTLAYLALAALGHRPGALAVFGLMAGALVAASGRGFLGLVAGVVLAVAAWRFAATVGFLVFIPPLAAFAFLATCFGRTLRAGHEPLISRIARKEHPVLPPEVARHTRRLTGAWAACFVALFLVSLGLAPFLPLEAWSRWVQVLGTVVPLGLFLGEYAYRHYRFPDRTPGSLAVLVANTVSVFHEISMEAGRPAAPGGKLP